MPYVPLYRGHSRAGGFNPAIRPTYTPAWMRRRAAEARMQRVANLRRGAYDTRQSQFYRAPPVPQFILDRIRMGINAALRRQRWEEM